VANEVVVTVTGRDRLSPELRKAQDSAERFGASLKSASTVAAVAFTAAIAAAGAAAIGATARFAAVGDDLAKMSARTGLGVQALSELKFAADQSGTSLEGLETAVRRMQGNILNAAQGTKTMTDNFTALGISVDEITGKTPEEQFDRISRAIADISDPTMRAAMATEVFGKQGTQLLPLLAAGAEGMDALRQQARDLGITMDEETAKKAERMNDALSSVRAAFDGMAFSIGASLAPAIATIAEALARELPRAFERAGDAVRRATSWLMEHKPVLIGIAAAIGALLVPAFVAAAVAVGGFIVAAAPLVGVALAVGGVTAAVMWLWENWDRIFTSMPEGVQNALRAIKGLAEGMVKFLLAPLNGLIDQINFISQAASNIPGLGALAGKTIPKVEVMFGALVDVAGSAVEKVKTAVGGLATSAVSATSKVTGTTDAMDGLSIAAGSAGEKVKTLADVMGQIENDLMQRRIQAFLKGGEEQAEIVRKQNEGMLDSARTIADLLTSTFGIKLPDAMEIAMKHVSDSADEMANAAEAAFKKIKGEAFDLTKQLWGASPNLSVGAAQGLAALADAAARGVTGSVDAAGNFTASGQSVNYGTINNNFSVVGEGNGAPPPGLTAVG